MINQPTIIPKTTHEQLLYSTILIRCDNSVGTGFFFNIKMNETENCTLIITNKHVIEGQTNITLRFHEQVDNEPTLDNIDFTTTVNPLLIPHPDENIDLVGILAGPIINQIKHKLKKEIFIRGFNIDYVFQSDKLRDLTDVTDDVIMIGYPTGLFDEANNYPIFRSGFCASHPAVNFNNQEIGLVDIACFPGSSGSPIVIYKQNYTDKDGNYNIGGKPIFILLGVLYAGPIHTSEGEIKVKPIPTSTQRQVAEHKQMMHLGYYVKANKINDIVQAVKDRFAHESN